MAGGYLYSSSIFLDFGIVFVTKSRWTRSRYRGPRAASVHRGLVGRGGGRLANVQPCHHLRGWSIATRGRKGGGDVGEPVWGDGLARCHRSWDNDGEEWAVGMGLDGDLVQVWTRRNQCGEELWGGERGFGAFYRPTEEGSGRERW
jgi:hypothetical protein